MANDQFSAREVAVLIENLENKFNVVLETVIPLRNDMAEVKERLTSVEQKLTSVEDVIRVAFPAINNRFSRIEAKLGI